MDPRKHVVVSVILVSVHSKSVLFEMPHRIEILTYQGLRKSR